MIADMIPKNSRTNMTMYTTGSGQQTKAYRYDIDVPISHFASGSAAFSASVFPGSAFGSFFGKSFSSMNFSIYLDLA